MAEEREEKAQKASEARVTQEQIAAETTHDKHTVAASKQRPKADDVTDERAGVRDKISGWAVGGLVGILVVGTVIVGTAIRGLIRIIERINGKQRDKSEIGTQGPTVYVKNTGKKYHRDGCRFLGESKNPIKLEEARQRYTP